MQKEQTENARIDAMVEARAEQMAQQALDEMAVRLRHRLNPPKIGDAVPLFDLGELHSTGDGVTLFDCRSGRTGCQSDGDSTIRYVD